MTRADTRKPSIKDGTTSAIVLAILSDPKHEWLTVRDIRAIAAVRGTPISVGSVASALASLEVADRVEVHRGQRPLRYRKGLFQ